MNPTHSKKTCTLLVALGLIALGAAGCSRAARTARILERAEQHYRAGDYEQAEIEFKNVLQKDGLNPQAIGRLGLLYHAQGREGRSIAFLVKAKELTPDDTEIRMKLGLVHLASGNLKEARDEALFILEREPQHAEAPLLLVETAATPKELDDTRRRLLALAGAAPKSAPVLVALANVEVRQNRLKEAQPLLEEALRVDAKSALVHTALGVHHWAQKNPAAADEAFKQAAALSPPRSPKRLHYAQFKLQQGDTAAAKQLFEEMSRATPDYVPAWVRLADIAFNEKRHDDCDALVAKALAREPFQPEALLLSARVKLARLEHDKAIAELEKMFSLYPKSGHILHQLAIAHVAKGETAKAIARLSQAVALAPTLTPATLLLAELNVRRRDYTAAVTSLKQLLQEQPDLAPARVLLAEAYRGQDALAEAIAEYQTLEKKHPREAQPSYLRGVVHLQQRQPAAARAAFARALQLAPSHFAALEQLVDLDLRDQQPAAARKRIAATLAANSGHATPHLLLAKVCLAEKNTAGAEEALKKAIELQPDSPTPHLLLARLYVGANQQDKAIASLREVIAANPKNLGATLLIAVLHDTRNDHAAARDAYEKALAIDPRSTLALNNLAYLYSERFNELDKAHDLAQRARALQPDEPRTADTLGWILSKRKHYAQALPLLQESAGKLPNEPEVHYHAGVTHYLLGDEEAARTALQRALELKLAAPDADDARQRLALLGSRVAAEARPLLERQLAVHPDDPVARVRLGEIFQREGDTDKAMANYTHALKVNPRSARAHLNIARVHETKHELPKALESAKAARALAPGDAEVAHVLGRLAYRTGEHRWAASLLQEAVKQNTDDAELQFDWAMAAFSIGRIAEVAPALERTVSSGEKFSAAGKARELQTLVAFWQEPARAAAAMPTIEAVLRKEADNPAALAALAAAHEHSSDWNAARQGYERVLALLPEFSPAQRQLALLYSRHPADAQKASAVAAKARQAYPSDPEIARAGGIIAYRQGDFGRAASLLQEAAAKRTADAELLYYLGMAQFRGNKRDASKETLQRALDLGLDGNLAVEARKSLATSG